MADYALAIGMDTAQGRPHDALEYTAGAGGAAFIIGPKTDSLAILEASYSYVTDTPDFFRRPTQHYPEHGHRFTGEPAYFDHVLVATRNFLEMMNLTAGDYQWAIFHQPNVKFPTQAAKTLGFKREQVQTGLLVGRIGNTYAGSSLIGFSAVLDVAKAGDRILLVSFGSGAGCDVFSFVATEQVKERRDRAPRTSAYVSRREYIDYATYARYRGKLVMN
jgi:hydroxymethylglutaryl-CoA synthase